MLDDDLPGEVHTFDHSDDPPWATADEALIQLGLDIEGVCDERGWEGDDPRNTFLGAMFIQIDEPEDEPGVCWVSGLPVPEYVVCDLPRWLPVVAATAPAGLKHWRTHWSDNVAPVAAVVSFEGWTLDVPINEMTPRQRWAAQNRQLNTLPERIEERHVMLCLHDGRVVIVNRRRGGQPVTEIVEDNDPKRLLRGTIPEAMRALTRTLVGVLWTGGE